MARPLFGSLPLLLLAMVSSAGSTLRAQEPPPAVLAHEDLLVDELEEVASGVARGWTIEGNGERVTGAADTRIARSGRAAWRITSRGVDYEEITVTRSLPDGVRGKRYTLEIWLRSRDIEEAVTVRVAGGGQRVEEMLVPADQWRRVQLSWTLPAGAGPAEKTSIRITCFTSGTLWLDALRMSEGDLPPPSRPPRPLPPLVPEPENRVYNGGFELGIHGWTGTGALEAVATATGTGAEGRRYLRWRTPEEPATLEGLPFAVRAGVPYCYSLSLRSPAGEREVEIALRERGSAGAVATRVRVGPAWQRVRVSAPLPCRGSRRYLPAVRAPAGCELQVDAVQVREGEDEAAAEYRPAAPVEVAVTLARQRPGNPVHLNDEVEARLLATAPYRPGSAVELRYRLEGYSGETLLVGRAARPAGDPEAGEVVEVPFRFRVPALGSLRLVAEAVTGTEVLSRAETWLLSTPAGEPAVPAHLPSVPPPGILERYGTSGPARSGTRGTAVRVVESWPMVPTPPTSVRRLLVLPRTWDGAYRSEHSLYEPDGSARPVMAALLAAERHLANARRVEPEQVREGSSGTPFRARAFESNGGTLLVYWSGTAIRAPRFLEVKLPAAAVSLWDLMGNPRPVRATADGVRLPVRLEPFYLRVEGLPAAAVGKSFWKAVTAASQPEPKAP